MRQMRQPPAKLKKTLTAVSAAVLAGAVLGVIGFLWLYEDSASQRQRLEYLGIELQLHSRAWVRDLADAGLGEAGAVDTAAAEARLVGMLAGRLQDGHRGWGAALFVPEAAVDALVSRWHAADERARAYFSHAAVAGDRGVAPPPEALLDAANGVQRASDALAAGVAAYRSRWEGLFIAAYAVGVAALLILALNAFFSYRAFQGRVAFNAAQNARYRAAMLYLRDAMQQLSAGQFPDAVNAPPGMDAVAEHFNEILARWRDTAAGVKAAAAEAAAAADGIRARAAEMARAASGQVERTTAASGTLNRLVPGADALARRAAAALDALPGSAASRGAAPSATGTLSGAVTTEQWESLDTAAVQLSEVVAQMSALLLHLVIRVHGTADEQQERPAPPYANQALQLAHQCAAATDVLKGDIAAMRSAARDRGAERTADADQPPPGGDAGALLAGVPDALHDHAAGLASLSDDMDSVHEYTMQLANGAGEVSRLIRRLADALERIGRDVNNYKLPR